MPFSTPIHTNEQSFERVLATGLPLLLVWTRKDYAPCARLDQALKRLASPAPGAGPPRSQFLISEFLGGKPDARSLG